MAISGHAIERSKAIEIARIMLDRSLQSSFISQDHQLRNDFMSIRNMLDTNISIRVNKCRGHRSKYVAYVNPDQNGSRITLCRKYNFIPKEELAQTIIHEASHLATGSSDIIATRHEVLASYLGGRTPTLNRYNTSEVILSVFEELTDEDMKSHDLDYYPLMNVRSIEELTILQIRTYATYRRCKALNYYLNKLCTGDLTCKKEILDTPDQFGVTINELNHHCKITRMKI